MAGIKIVGFLGTAPKISPELLPNTAGQIANNCKLYSGDLIPYPQPVVVGNAGQTGTIKTLFALRDPDTNEKKWLSWTTDVDIAIASKTNKDEQRFYYSGDGKPKVSNYELATTGAAPYPVGYYDLGLEPPDDALKLTTVAGTFTEKTTASFSRDAGSVATIVTSTPHGLRTGNQITVSGFTYSTGTYTQAKSTRTGSYSEASGTLSIMVTVTDHGLSSGQVVDLEFGNQLFNNHADLNGAYSVAVVDKDIFAVTAPSPAARSGTITWKNAGTTTIVVTINNHGLSNGAQVSLDFTSGTATDGVYTATNVTTNTFEVITTNSNTTSGDVRLDMRSFNATNVECTVVNDTTLTYFSPGPQVASTPFTDGKVELGGLTQARSYTFTWVTPWGEESIAAKPSDDLFIKEGTTVTVSNIPTAKPAGNNFVRGVKLYRTLAAASGTEFYLLQTLWFPIGITKVSRTSVTSPTPSVSTITTLYPHNLSVDDRFLIRGLTGSAASFNAAGTVTDVVDDYAFKFVQTGLGGTGEINVVGGFVYHDVSENPPTTPPRYWGYNVSGTYAQTGTTTMTITAAAHGLAANSKVYLTFSSGAGVSGVYTINSVASGGFTVTAPAATTSGNVTVEGYTFIDDFESRDLFDILGTDNYDPPPEDLQGLTAIQNNILVGFVGNTLYFSEPGAPHAWPAAYAVNLEHNIVGIAAISGSALVTTDSYPYIVSGSDPANGMSTARIDANFPCLNKNSMVTMGYGVVYSTHDGLAVYSANSGPTIITKLLYNNDTWQTAIDPKTVVAEYYGDNYFASHSTGAFVFEQDAKVGGFFVNCDYSFTASWYDAIDGIVYYVSGTNGDIYEWDNLDQPPVTQEWKSKVIVTKDMINLGAARVIADYASVTEVWDANTTLWELESTTWDAADGVTFRLWVNKQLEFETVVLDTGVFRLPTGYRTDTFEVGVEGNIRVRAIHLAETSLGLREV